MNDLRKIQLHILDKVTEVLEENKLDYWLDSGTLLGARRHQGFIPWDDDIDIAVHMRDYEKIIRLLVNELPQDLQVQDNGLKAMSLELAPIKIFYKPSKIKDKVTGIHSHVFIDLFVYSPINPIIIKSKFNIILKSLILPKSEKLLPRLNGIRKIVIPFLDSLITKNQLNSLIQKMRKSQVNSDYLAYDFLCWPTTVYHHKDEIFPLKKMLFEGKYYNVPNNVDAFLSQQYGNNFMELPPVEEREGSHIIYYEITKFPNEK